MFSYFGLDRIKDRDSRAFDYIDGVVGEVIENYKREDLKIYEKLLFVMQKEPVPLSLKRKVRAVKAIKGS